MTHPFMSTGVPASLFGDDETRDRWLAECAAARRTQTVQYAVAPRMQIPAPGGRVLKAGQAVTLEDLHGGSEPAWQTLERLLHSSMVLEAESFHGPQAA